MIIPPHKQESIVRTDGIAQQSMASWIDQVTILLNQISVVEGSGSPEGVLTAPKHKVYFNTSGSPGTYYYRKTTDSNLNTGWVAIG